MSGFWRAPDSEDPAEVIDWLLRRGCTDIRLFLGPDGRVRGSGKVAPVHCARCGRFMTETGGGPHWRDYRCGCGEETTIDDGRDPDVDEGPVTS